MCVMHPGDGDSPPFFAFGWNIDHERQVYTEHCPPHVDCAGDPGLVPGTQAHHPECWAPSTGTVSLAYLMSFFMRERLVSTYFFVLVAPYCRDERHRIRRNVIRCGSDQVLK